MIKYWEVEMGMEYDRSYSPKIYNFETEAEAMDFYSKQLELKKHNPDGNYIRIVRPKQKIIIFEKEKQPNAMIRVYFLKDGEWKESTWRSQNIDLPRLRGKELEDYCKTALAWYSNRCADEDDLRMVLEINGKEVFDFRENKLI